MERKGSKNGVVFQVASQVFLRLRFLPPLPLPKVPLGSVYIG